MEDTLIDAEVMIFFITILGIIPYGIWVIYSLFKKRWKRMAFQIAIPMVAYACLYGAMVLCRSTIYDSYLSELFDSKVKLGTAIFEYDSERAFNGDGNSFAVYELPSSIRRRFESADKRLLTEFPKHPSYRDHWSFEHWREAPLDNKFQECLDFAVSSPYSDVPSKLDSYSESLRKALERQGTYYALFQNRPAAYLSDIDFFVVDLKEGRIYIINHNT